VIIDDINPSSSSFDSKLHPGLEDIIKNSKIGKKNACADVKSGSNSISLISNKNSTDDQHKKEMSRSQTSVKVESDRGVLKLEKRTQATTCPAESPDLLLKSSQPVATKKKRRRKKKSPVAERAPKKKRKKRKNNAKITEKLPKKKKKKTRKKKEVRSEPMTNSNNMKKKSRNKGGENFRKTDNKMYPSVPNAEGNLCLNEKDFECLSSAATDPVSIANELLQHLKSSHKDKLNENSRPFEDSNASTRVSQAQPSLSNLGLPFPENISIKEPCIVEGAFDLPPPVNLQTVVRKKKKGKKRKRKGVKKEKGKSKKKQKGKSEKLVKSSSSPKKKKRGEKSKANFTQSPKKRRKVKDSVALEPRVLCALINGQGQSIATKCESTTGAKKDEGGTKLVKIPTPKSDRIDFDNMTLMNNKFQFTLTNDPKLRLWKLSTMAQVTRKLVRKSFLRLKQSGNKYSLIKFEDLHRVIFLDGLPAKELRSWRVTDQLDKSKKKDRRIRFLKWKTSPTEVALWFLLTKPVVCHEWKLTYQKQGYIEEPNFSPNMHPNGKISLSSKVDWDNVITLKPHVHALHRQEGSWRPIIVNAELEQQEEHRQENDPIVTCTKGVKGNSSADRCLSLSEVKKLRFYTPGGSSDNLIEEWRIVEPSRSRGPRAIKWFVRPKRVALWSFLTRKVSGKLVPKANASHQDMVFVRGDKQQDCAVSTEPDLLKDICNESLPNLNLEKPCSLGGLSSSILSSMSSLNTSIPGTTHLPKLNNNMPSEMNEFDLNQAKHISLKKMGVHGNFDVQATFSSSLKSLKHQVLTSESFRDFGKPAMIKKPNFFT